MCIAALIAVSGCGGREGTLDVPRDVLAPVALGQDLAYVDRSRDEVLLLDVGSADLRPRARRASLPASPVWRAPRRQPEDEAGPDELLVLSAGTQESLDAAGEDPALVALDADTLELRRYPLRSPLDSVRQSSDGRFAFLFLSDPDRVPGLLANPNEVAVVDLEAEPSDTNPAVRTLVALGSAPSDVVFSPHPVRVGERARRLAVAFSHDYVSVFDLARPEAAEKTVPLSIPGEASAGTPVQVLFSRDEPRIYVRTAASDAIAVIQLTPDPEDDATFRANITQVSAGRRPTDMLLYQAEDDRPRLLVAAPGSSEVAVIEPRSGRVTHIPLDWAPERLLRFEAAAPGGSTSAERVLLYGGSASQRIGFVDLQHLEERKTRNLDSLAVRGPVGRLVPLLDQGVAVLLHSATDPGAPQLSVLDLSERTLSPIFAQVPLEDAVVDRDAERIWVAPPGSTALGSLSLGAFEPDEVLLDAPLDGFLSMSRSTGRIVITHPGEEGLVTVLDADAPSRDTATVLRGFLLGRLLERGER